MNQFVILIIFIGVLVDLVWVIGSKIYFQRHPNLPEGDFRPVLIRGRMSPGLTLLRLGLWHLRRHPLQFFKRLLPAMEVLLVAAWALWAGRALLNFSLIWMPPGIDFPLAVRDNYFWSNLFQCGGCALWNGNYDGGYPALLDLLGAPLHPIVALPAIAFGVVNGGKIAVVLALALAGIAQLWIGYTLELDRPARVWAALMAVVAGSLTGRMEIGQVTLVVSTATGALWIAALLHLYRRRTNHNAVLLALATSLLLLSGQGYIQIAIAFAIVPAGLILFLAPAPNRSEWLEKIQVAGILGVLSAAVLAVPMLNNLSGLYKDTNLGYTSILPLGFQLLSLVHPNPPLTQQQLEWGWGMSFQTHNFLGWGPLLLALMTPLLVPKKHRRLLCFFLVAIVLVYFCSTMRTPRFLLDWINPEIAAGIRHPGVMTGLVGPLLLALAAWSLDRLDKFITASPRFFVRSFGWFLIVCLALVSLMSVYNSSLRWLTLIDFAAEEAVIEHIQPDKLAWMRISDEHYWNLLAFERGMKLTGTFHPWHFAAKEAPPPALYVSREPIPLLKNNWPSWYRTLYMMQFPENYYASAAGAGGWLVYCPAQATGGWIRVTCEMPADGILTVMEHTWSGWRASVDGAPARLRPGQWLSVDLPQGRHSIEFRYLPWDVPLGLALSLVGIGLMGLWLKSRAW